MWPLLQYAFAIPAADIKERLIADDTTYEGTDYHPREFEKPAVCGKSAQHKDGLPFQEGAYRYGDIAVIGYQFFQ